jgi:hypothetical protein
VLALAPLALAGCELDDSVDPASPAPEAAPRPGPHEVAATLQRFGCYGECPIYQLAIYRDGVVEYDGEHYVKTRGHATGRLTAGELDALDAAFAHAHFFALRLDGPYWRSFWTDMPTVRTSYQLGSHFVMFDDYHGSPAPDALVDLEDRIDAIVHVERWIGSDVDRDDNPI